MSSIKNWKPWQLLTWTIGSVLVSAALRFVLTPYLGDTAQLLPFLLATMSTSVIGGFRFGLLASILGTLTGTELFILPLNEIHRIETHQTIFISLFFVESVLISAVVSYFVKATHAAAERQRITSNQFFELANHMTQLAWIANADGSVHWYNKRWYEYTGTTLAEMKGWGWSKCQHPDQVDRVVDFVKNAWKNPEPWELIFPLKSATGEWRWFLTRAVPLTGGRGEIVQWFVTNTDINVQIQNEEKLKLFASVMDQSSDFIGIANADRQVIYANQAGRKIVGLEASDDIRKTTFLDYISDYISREDRDYAEKSILPQIEKHGSWRGESNYQHFKNHKWTSMLCNLFQIKNDKVDVVAISTVSSDITEIKKMETSLRESEAKFHTMMEAIPQLVWSTNESGSNEYFNHNWFEFTGASQNPEPDQTWAAYFHPDDQKLLWEKWSRCLQTGEPYEIQCRLKHNSGEYRWVLGRAVPLLGEGGKILRWFGTCTDIHEQKKAQESLETFWNLPNHLLIIGNAQTGYFKALSPAWEQILGWSISELTAKPWIDFVHPEDVKSTVAAHNSVLTSGKPAEVENRYRHRDGSYRWFKWSASLYGDQVFGTVTDITNLREKEENLRLANSVAQIGTFEWNLGTNQIHWSPELEKVYGLEPGEMEHSYESWKKLIHPEDVTRAEAELERALETGSYTSEWRAHWPDGQIKWIQARALVEKDSFGKPIRIRGVNIDVTEIKRIQKYLENAKSEAEKASSLKTAFLASMSHELRTPLGAMIGFADLLRDPDVTPDERVQYANIIVRNGDRLATLINDVLDISKIEAGRLTLHYQKVNPHEVIKEVVSLLKVKALEKNIPLLFEIDPSTPQEFVTDPFRLRQVLLNLVGNSIKFTFHGSVKIRCSPRKLDSRKDDLCFDVIDTGIGIPADQHNQIFEMFTQADGVRAQQFGGTGLGLPLSRKLARALDGDVVIFDSKPQKGTTFRVTIASQPLRKSDTTEALISP